MSLMTRGGLRAPLPVRNGGFQQQVLSQWAGGDRGRLRKLAALQLRTICGWTHREIGQALGVSKQRAEQLEREARICLRETFARPTDRDLAPGADVGDDGFSDPFEVD